MSWWVGLDPGKIYTVAGGASYDESISIGMTLADAAVRSAGLNPLLSMGLQLDGAAARNADLLAGMSLDIQQGDFSLTESFVAKMAEASLALQLDDSAAPQIDFNPIITLAQQYSDSLYPDAMSVYFDGTGDDYLTSAGLTGAVDGTDGTCSVWVKFDSDASGTNELIYATGSQRFIIIRWGSGGQLTVRGRDSTGTNTMYTQTNVSLNGGVWYHVAASWSTSDVHLYLDGVDVLTAGSKVVPVNDIDYNRSGSIARVSQALNGIYPMAGCLSDLWVSYTDYLDLDVAGNLAKFYDSGWVDVALTMPTPIVFMRGDRKTFQNIGTGGPFTVVGTLGVCRAVGLAAEAEVDMEAPLEEGIVLDASDSGILDIQESGTLALQLDSSSILIQDITESITLALQADSSSDRTLTIDLAVALALNADISTAALLDMVGSIELQTQLLQELSSAGSTYSTEVTFVLSASDLPGVIGDRQEAVAVGFVLGMATEIRKLWESTGSGSGSWTEDGAETGTWTEENGVSGNWTEE